MAAVGSKLTIPFLVGTGQIGGQGNKPELWVLYTTDDASVANPNWIDATAKVRSFSTVRGRESELQDVDAGTATITVDNKDRTFDPDMNANIRPMNRWWIRTQFTGETQDLFKGYADSYQQDWDAPVGSAQTRVALTDEVKVLALDALPTTAPPRSSYGDLVQSDNPAGYWPLNEDPATLIQPADIPEPSATLPPNPDNGLPFGDEWGWVIGKRWPK